jgi:hypothetical protein
MSDTAPPPPPASMQHPDCTHDPAECRISVRASYVTAAQYAPVFDGWGRSAAGPDPNVQTTVMACATCGAEWSVERQAGAVGTPPTIITKTAPT